MAQVEQLRKQPVIWRAILVLGAMVMAGCSAEDAFKKSAEVINKIKPKSTYDYVRDLKRFKDSPDKRREAYRELGEPDRFDDDPELQEKIIGILELAVQGERDEMVRMQAATSLGMFHFPRSQVALDKGKDDPSPLVRQEIAKSTNRIRQPGGEETLLHLLKDKSANVRAVAAAGLGFWSTGKTVFGLVDALDDDDAAVRLRARQALSRALGEDQGADPNEWRKWIRENGWFQAES